MGAPVAAPARPSGTGSGRSTVFLSRRSSGHAVAIRGYGRSSEVTADGLTPTRTGSLVSCRHAAGPTTGPTLCRAAIRPALCSRSGPRPRSSMAGPRATPAAGSFRARRGLTPPTASFTAAYRGPATGSSAVSSILATPTGPISCRLRIIARRATAGPTGGRTTGRGGCSRAIARVVTISTCTRAPTSACVAGTSRPAASAGSGRSRATPSSGRRSADRRGGAGITVSGARSTASTATPTGGPTGRTRPVRRGTSTTAASVSVYGRGRPSSTYSGSSGSVLGAAARAPDGYGGSSCRVCSGVPSGASAACPICSAAGFSSINAGTSRCTSTRSSGAGQAGTTVARVGPFTAWSIASCRGVCSISPSSTSRPGDGCTTGGRVGSAVKRRRHTVPLGDNTSPSASGVGISRPSFSARPRRVIRTPVFRRSRGAGAGPTIGRRPTPAAVCPCSGAGGPPYRVSRSRGK